VLLFGLRNDFLLFSLVYVCECVRVYTVVMASSADSNCYLSLLPPFRPCRRFSQRKTVLYLYSMYHYASFSSLSGFFCTVRLDCSSLIEYPFNEIHYDGCAVDRVLWRLLYKMRLFLASPLLTWQLSLLGYQTALGCANVYLDASVHL
jgi:hypothetical protein